MNATAIATASVLCEFFVPGVPAPGGSKKLVRYGAGVRPVIVDDCKRNHSWRKLVASHARRAWLGEPTSEPLSVRFEFVLLRPRGHFGSGRNAGQVRKTARAYPTTKPDVLKLARSTEDALTGIAWVDDSANIELRLSKRYGDQAGCRVIIQTFNGGLENASDR